MDDTASCSVVAQDGDHGGRDRADWQAFFQQCKEEARSRKAAWRRYAGRTRYFGFADPTGEYAALHAAQEKDSLLYQMKKRTQMEADRYAANVLRHRNIWEHARQAHHKFESWRLSCTAPPKPTLTSWDNGRGPISTLGEQNFAAVPPFSKPKEAEAKTKSILKQPVQGNGVASGAVTAALPPDRPGCAVHAPSHSSSRSSSPEYFSTSFEPRHVVESLFQRRPVEGKVQAAVPTARQAAIRPASAKSRGEISIVSAATSKSFGSAFDIAVNSRKSLLAKSSRPVTAQTQASVATVANRIAASPRAMTLHPAAPQSSLKRPLSAVCHVAPPTTDRASRPPTGRHRVVLEDHVGSKSLQHNIL